MYGLLRGKVRWGIVNAKVREIENIRRNLYEMFEEAHQKKVLSQTLKIFPTYFNKSYIDEFCQTNNFNEYLSYIKIKVSNKDVSETLKLFQKNQTTPIDFTATGMKILEAYLYWLTNECPSFKPAENDFLIEFINLERPDKWYIHQQKTEPRVFIYHHGPTNSGKSTSAIQQLKTLKEDQVGIYMAPLRLLAWQYQQKLGNCTLLTGQQKQYKNSNLISCTIETAPLDEEYEVAVIDEIQMIGDRERGSAWTKALLALKAKRIHLCGDERALGIVSKIVQICGDKLEQRKYSRLSKLILIHKPFELSQMEPGDCVINFSINKLIKHRNDINKMLHYRQLNQHEAAAETQKTKSSGSQSKEKEGYNYKNQTAIVYGKLPPDCRKQQAKAFNSNKLPYLVATNAIGMGLNLNIKKIILMDCEKSDRDRRMVELQEHDIQQIAGRAGRGTETGYVQCANKHVLQKVKKALSRVNQTYGIQLQNLQDESNEKEKFEEELHSKKKYKRHPLYNKLLNREMTEKETDIKQATIYFDARYLKDFHLLLLQIMKINLPVSQILEHLTLYAKLSSNYTLQETQQIKYIFSLLEDSKLDVQDILLFYIGLSLSQAQFGGNKNLFNQVKTVHKNYIKDFIQKRKVPLPSFIVDDYYNDYEQYQYIDQILELQISYSLLESYVWLWGKYEFPFFEVKLARKIKSRLQAKFNQVLVNNRFTKDSKFITSDKDKNKTQPFYESFEETKRLEKRGKTHQRIETPKFLKEMMESEKEKRRVELSVNTLQLNPEQQL